VLLDTYRLRDLPYMTFRKAETFVSWEDVNKTCCCCPEPAVDLSLPPFMGVAKITPRLVKRPVESQWHPCRKDDGYSRHRCQLDSYWSSRVNRLRKLYGARMDCILPGVLRNETNLDRLPICTKDVEAHENDTIGYSTLTTNAGQNGRVIITRDFLYYIISYNNTRSVFRGRTK